METKRDSKISETQTNSIIKWDSEDINFLKNFMNLIEDIKKDTNKSINIFDSDQNLFNDLNKYINEERKIYISMFGQYSSGKTSFINDLIGENIFETDININTNKGILIQNSDEKNIYKLEKIKFKKKEDYYYFERIDNNNEKYEGKEKVFTKLKEINKEVNENIEDCFYLITLNIKKLKKIDKNIRNKIVFIDFPGLGVVDDNLNQKINFFETYVFPELIKQIDCFLFFNKDLYCNSFINDFFRRLDKKLYINKIDNSFKNIIFIMSFWDQENDNKERTDKDLLNIKNEYEKMLAKKDLCVIKYSHNYYKFYKNWKKKLNSYQNYSKQSEEEKKVCIFNEYYQFYIEEEEEEEEEKEEFIFGKENFIEFMYSKMIKNGTITNTDENFDENFKINENEKKIFEENLKYFLKEKKLKNISKLSFENITNLYLKYKHNYKLFSEYKNKSNYKEIINELKNLISKANLKMEEEIRLKLNDFMQKFFDKITEIKKIINGIKETYQTKKIEKSMNNIKELFDDCYSEKPKNKIFIKTNFGNIFKIYKDKIINYINNYNISINIEKKNKNEIITEIQNDLSKIENEFEKLLEEKYLYIKNFIINESKNFDLNFIFNRKKIELTKNYEKINQNYSRSFFRKFLDFFLSDKTLLKNEIEKKLKNLKSEYNIYFQDYEKFYNDEIEILKNKTNNHFQELININNLQINNLIKDKINIIDMYKDNFKFYLKQKYNII